MSFNGSGVFQRLYSWVNDAAANIRIRADRMDAEMNGMATGLSTCITKDGQTTITANLPMAGFNHTGVGNATSRNHYASFGQLQDGKANWVAAGGTSDAITAAYSIPVTALVDGQLFYVRASAANATTTPTFNPNSLGAQIITKNGAAALVAGDIPGASYEMVLRYRLSDTKYELLNPAIPVATAPFVDTTAIVKGSVDATKLVRFEVDGLTTATTRVLTVPDADLTIVGLDTTQTLTNKTLTNPDVTTQSANNNTTKAASTAFVLGQSASQAEQETATSTTKFVSPGTQQFHPSAAKFWLKCDAAGTINASYNVTSITDVGTGRVDITIATDFSSANWACHVSVLDSINIRFPQLIAQAAGTAQFICHSTGFVAADPTSWFITGHGDQ